MSLEYFPLIGIDASRNEHPFEWPGKNWEEAARSGAIRYSYLKVLSNYAGQKRGGNGSGMYNRKPLYEAPLPEVLNGSAEILPANSSFAELAGQRADIAALRLIKHTPELIEKLRSYGFVLYLKEVDGLTKLFNDRRVTCGMTKPEVGQINDLVRERRREIIAALETEEDAQRPAAAVGENGDPLKGKKIQDIMLSMLPQMPTPFTIGDLTARLSVAGFKEFAADRARVASNIQYAITKKQIASAGRGKYRVVEEFRHRRAASEYPLKDAYDSATGATPEQQPDAIIEPVTAQPELQLESLRPPRAVIEVPAPEPEPEPEPAPVTAVDAQRMLVATVLDLASQAAAAGEDDMLSLASKWKEAVEQCQNAVLDALTALSAAGKPFMEQVLKRHAAKQALLRSLAIPPKNEG